MLLPSMVSVARKGGKLLQELKSPGLPGERFRSK